MALKSVLILTASFGEGHNAAARNLAGALRLRNPKARVEVRDVFHESYGWINLFVRDAYLAAINHTPALWRFVFGLLDRPSVLGGGIGIFGRAARHLDSLIRDLSPDVIVSTYPGYGHLLEHLRRIGKIHSAKIATVVTDSLSINSAWYRPYTDCLLVANQATADVIARAGFPLEKIRVTGFPVPPLFDEPSDRAESPPWQVLYMVNSSHHLAPEIVRAILTVPEISLTVTAGHDEKLAGQVRDLATRLHIPVAVYGWTPEIPALIRRSHLLISKAGGATVQEALAARTPMIITQIVPGQEEGNARLLIEGGAGEFAGSAEEISEAVRRSVGNGAQILHQRCAATKLLSQPGASTRAAECIENLAL